jgi:hypothetical protein
MGYDGPDRVAGFLHLSAMKMDVGIRFFWRPFVIRRLDLTASFSLESPASI